MASAAGVAVAASLPKVASARPQAEGSDLDRRLADAEKQLAKPLSPEAKKIAGDMLKAVDDLSQSRMKQRLPENSEPCFTYIPTAAPSAPVKK